jgi:hypothetical protein
MFVAVRLAKGGYLNGDPSQVLNAPVDVVQSILEYENFEADYSAEYARLNELR